MSKSVSFAPINLESNNIYDQNICKEDHKDMEDSKENIEDNKEESIIEDSLNLQKTYTKYTRFCLFGLGKCKKGIKCLYAHTIKEINVITCKWNDECLRKEKCYFKHSNETKTQYIKRSFPADVKRLNISLFEPKVYNHKPKEINKPKEIKYTEDFVEYLRNFKLMYYDPIMDVRRWEDIDDSDDDEPYPYF